MKKNPFQQVADIIIEVIEENLISGNFTMPWHRGELTFPVNALNGNPYNGINVITLWCIAHKRRYETNRWATFKQWKQAGAKIKKGEHGAPIFFYRNVVKEHINDQGEAEEYTYHCPKRYYVYNIDQVDGAEAIDIPPGKLVEAPIDLNGILNNHQINVRIDGHRAFYSSQHDVVTMPDLNRFGGSLEEAQESYNAVLAHEITHWTGPRVKRALFTKKVYDQADLAREELVAEFGAAFLCCHLGITNEPRKDHAQYLASYLQVIKEDSKALTRAASQAAAAVSYLLKSPNEAVV